jgi:hypothetical protein
MDLTPDTESEALSRPALRSSAPEVERLYVSNFDGYNSGSLIEVRSASTGSRTIGGYAAVFNRMSENLGGFREKIAPGFFNQSRSQGFPGVVCRYNHEDSFLLGTTRSGTLRLSIDELGLDYAVDLPECRSDIYELTQREDLRHSSFAFQCYDEDWSKGDGGYPVRQLLSGRLIDVAPVNTPAYPDATVGLRSLARFVDAPLEDVVAIAKQNELRKFFIRTDVTERAMNNDGAYTSDSYQEQNAAAEPGIENDGDDVSDPGKMLAGIDAVVDEAVNLTMNVDRSGLPPEVGQALDLILSAATAIDELMETMGVYDPDDVGSDGDRALNENTETATHDGKFGPSALMEILARRTDDPII